MVRHKMHSILILTSLALLAPLALSAQGAPEEADENLDVYQRSYPLSNLSSYAAELLVLEQCPGGEADYDRCRVLDANSERIVVAADAATHQKIAETLGRAAQPRATPQLQIVLVRALADGEGIDAAVPDNVHGALEDASTLLPYSRFELLDAGLVRSQRSAELKLVDDKGRRFDVGLTFTLEPGADGVRLDFHQFQVIGRGTPDGEEARQGQLLSTSFDMALGETLLVGASKLNGGGEALIALVTAIDSGG